MMNYRKLFLSALALPPLFFGARILAAAGNLSFTVNPMTKEITADAGSQQTGTVEIRNDGERDSQSGPLRLKVYLVDWTMDAGGSVNFVAPGTTAGSCAAWLQVNPAELTIAPGATATVRYTAHVPPAAAGTFHTLMMFESAPAPQTIDAREVSVNGRIGLTLYLQVGPQVKRAKISAFEITDQHTAITVQNTGTSQLRLRGTLKYTDEHNQVLAQMPIPSALLLPGEDGTRVFSLDTPSLPRNQPVTVTVLLDYGGTMLAGARAHVTLP